MNDPAELTTAEPSLSIHSYRRPVSAVESNAYQAAIDAEQRLSDVLNSTLTGQELANARTRAEADAVAALLRYQRLVE